LCRACIVHVSLRSRIKVSNVDSAVQNSQERANSGMPRVRNIKRRPCRSRSLLPSRLFSPTWKDEGCGVLSVAKADCAILLELSCSLHDGVVAMPTRALQSLSRVDATYCERPCSRLLRRLQQFLGRSFFAATNLLQEVQLVLGTRDRIVEAAWPASLTHRGHGGLRPT